MRRIIKLLAALALALSTLAVSAPTALAAPPSNDTFSGAKPVAIGFSETLDTTQATTDANDAQMNPDECGAPATDASVWYAFQGADQGVLVDVSQSSYFAGVLVSTGSPGNFTFVECGPDSVAFFAEAGTTYYVLAIDDQFDGGGNGGTLRISFNEIPPPPTVDITVNPSGTVNVHTGVATISGTYTCTNGEFIDVNVEAHQGNGRRFTIIGFGFFTESGTCDGAPHKWSAEVIPENGRFAGGKALTVTFTFSCGPVECTEGSVEQTVKLRAGKK